jgi:hypothetical protein
MSFDEGFAERYEEWSAEKVEALYGGFEPLTDESREYVFVTRKPA